MKRKIIVITLGMIALILFVIIIASITKFSRELESRIENDAVVISKQSYPSAYDSEFYIVVKDIKTEEVNIIRHIPMRYYSSYRIGDTIKNKRED